MKPEGKVSGAGFQQQGGTLIGSGSIDDANQGRAICLCDGPPWRVRSSSISTTATDPSVCWTLHVQ
jgi:hypothetical protein